GDVYAIDGDDRVEKFGSTGQFLLMIGGEVDKTTHANLCTAASGDICGAGISGVGPGKFESLGHDAIAVGPTGTLYVGDKERIQEFSPGGVFETQIPITGVTAEEIAVDSTDDIYVV